jgi:hypothetical protein
MVSFWFTIYMAVLHLCIDRVQQRVPARLDQGDTADTRSSIPTVRYSMLQMAATATIPITTRQQNIGVRPTQRRRSSN